MEAIVQFVQEIWQTLRSGGFPDLGVWSYVLLILLAATEGPFSVLLGAAAAAGGYLRLDWVYLAALIGNVIGDIGWYLVGYSGRLERIVRIGRYVGLRPAHITKLEGAVLAHATKLILLAKLSISLMIPTLVAAGLARVPWRRWFPVVFVVEMVWVGLLMWVGYHLTGLLAEVEHGLHVVGIVVIVAGLVGVAWFGRRRFLHEEQQDIPPLQSELQPPPRRRTKAANSRPDQRSYIELSRP